MADKTLTIKTCTRCGQGKSPSDRDLKKFYGIAITSELVHITSEIAGGPRISIAQYDHLVEVQEGLCAICRKPCPTGRNLAVDHDHETGQIRGLLCIKCNLGVGAFEDDPERLMAAVVYLLGFEDGDGG